MPPDDPGLLLVEAGLIGDQQLALARRAQSQTGGTLGEHLVLAGFIADEELTAFYQTRLRVPRVSQDTLYAIPARVLRKVPQDMAIEFRILPIAADGEQNLTVAMSDPSDRHAVEEVAFFTGCYVVRTVATQAQIAWGLDHYYGVTTPLSLATEPAEAPPPVEDLAPGPRRAETIRPPEAVRRAHIDLMSQDPELAPRSGEFTAQPAPDEPLRLPAVVVEEVEDDIAEGAPENPILLERPPTAPERGSDEVVLLEERRRRPTSRPTQPGIGRPGTVDSRRQPRHDTGLSPGPGPGNEGTSRNQLRSDRAGPLRGDQEDHVSRSEERQSKSGRSSAATTPAPRRSSSPGKPARAKTPSVDEGWDVDDGWGPPGTTIPPAFIGATPSALSEAPQSGRIPLAVQDDATGEVLEAENADPEAPVAAPDQDTAPVRAEPSAQAAAPSAPPTAPAVDPAELAAELERSSNRLLETVRKLERASSRDDVVELLLDHLGRLCGRRAFLAIKGGALHPFRQQGASRPGVGTAALSLKAPSTLAQVAQSRLPYHGPVSPEAAEFVAGGLGSAPDADAVVVPILLRGRAIALLYGDSINGRVFDEHQMVLGRAAGQALERILVSQKGN